MPTLSLSIIVGADEAFELERCLKSVHAKEPGSLFDEIVVCVTAEDPKVLEVAHRLAHKVPRFKWIENFAAARNFCLDCCTQDYWFWLDSDDIIKPGDYQKLLDLKPTLDQHEVIWLMYNYTHDPNDEPGSPLPRERIFRRSLGYRWSYPVHEIVIHPRYTDLRDSIAIDHYRTKPFNPQRNLRILEREWNKSPRDPRMAFYYARDLFDGAELSGGASYLQRAEEVAIQVVENNWVGQPDERAALCRSLASKFYNEKRFDLCERYCYLGLSASTKFAELYSWLGCMAYDQKQEDRAEKLFEAALACRYESLLGPLTPYYKLVPAQNLFMINFFKGDFTKALLYNKMILEADPGNVDAIKNRDLCWFRFRETFDIAPNHAIAPAPKVAVMASPSPSVCWMLPFLNLDDPGTRIRRYNISEALARKGIPSVIVHDYWSDPLEKTLEQLRDAAVIVFSMVSDYDRKLGEALKAQGKRVVVDVCEAIFGIPNQSELFALADWVVCCSTKLGEMVKEKGFRNVAVIRDAVEIGV